MGRRFTLWLKQQNRVQVVTPSEFSKRINLYGLGEMTEEEKIKALLSAGKELNVDVVIILDSNTPKADIAGYGALVGKKSKLHHKFLVSLLSVVDQKVVWQDELPYSVTISTTHVASEEEIDKAVAEKFIGRFKAVVLGEKEQASELFLKFGDLAA